ncbi:MAG: arylesterase [Rhodobacter sp.]|nr:arylesterase [Rhodobacter sp.]MCY4168029.1 arylesterase [Rhodobacter sp.]MCY4242230.1 arylesterase [Rhodobacter sp.]
MDSFLMEINSLGYGALRQLRNLSIAALIGLGSAHAETVTIAALGDSLTQGYGLPPDQGFVPQLQTWLDADGADTVIVNAGVSGDTTQGGLARVDWTLTEETDALIVALGANDVLRGIEPSVVRANLEGILGTAVDAGVPVLLAGFAAPGNYGPDYKNEFDAIFPDLATEFGALFIDRFLEPIIREGDESRPPVELLQADGLHPNREGVALIVEQLGPKVAELANRVREKWLRTH